MLGFCRRFAAEMKEFFTCGCWQDEAEGIAKFCKYHEDLAAAEEES